MSAWQRPVLAVEEINIKIVFFFHKVGGQVVAEEHWQKSQTSTGFEKKEERMIHHEWKVRGQWN